ncbi:MAG: type II toxin-antitoxin system ParD family antitoxin [Nitrospira sp.]|nr:type II toxin-antitoxin system ParD family antitoxin [Nitrospira sp.]
MAEKLSITLPSNMVGLIRDRVQAGAYASVSEVLREAMRVWMREEEEHETRMTAVRARIRSSLDDPRPNLTSEEARKRLAAYCAERTAET